MAADYEYEVDDFEEYVEPGNYKGNVVAEKGRLYVQFKTKEGNVIRADEGEWKHSDGVKADGVSIKVSEVD